MTDVSIGWIEVFNKILVMVIRYSKNYERESDNWTRRQWRHNFRRASDFITMLMCVLGSEFSHKRGMEMMIDFVWRRR
jgi:hypothetical protein